MATFIEVLGSPAEGLVNIFHRVVPGKADTSAKRARQTSRQLGLSSARMTCALGFNPAIRDLDDVIIVAGFTSYEDLVNHRNAVFLQDVYRQLSIDDVLCIYVHVKHDPRILEVMQYLLAGRLHNIEHQIDSTVNSLTIERYKKEMRAIYSEGIAQIEFAEERLSNTDSGFRALINEVSIMVEARVIPVGDIFFRDTVLPEEKRKLIGKGYIPRELIVSRLEDEDLPEQERRMLEEQLRLGG